MQNMSTQKESIDSYFNYDRQKLFSILLDLLEVFREFCKKNKLHFYAQGGTMLGAVRHKGFIPWDDDIDLAMFRADFDRLLTLIETETLPSPYKFLTPLTDTQYDKGIVRLCNTNTTAIPVHDAIFDYNHGIFIDIFPLDAIPDIPYKFFIYKKKMTAYAKGMMLLSRFSCNDASDRVMRAGNKVIFHLLKPFYQTHLLKRETLFRAFTKAASAYEGRDQKRICLSTFMAIPRYINLRSDYDVKIIDMPFENTTVPVPETYDRILRIHYGDNYMTPIHENTMHGDTLFSTDIPYKDFVNMYSIELKNLWLNYRENLKKNGQKS